MHHNNGKDVSEVIINSYFNDQPSIMDDCLTDTQSIDDADASTDIPLRMSEDDMGKDLYVYKYRSFSNDDKSKSESSVKSVSSLSSSLTTLATTASSLSDHVSSSKYSCKETNLSSKCASLPSDVVQNNLHKLRPHHIPEDFELNFEGVFSVFTVKDTHKIALKFYHSILSFQSQVLNLSSKYSVNLFYVINSSIYRAQVNELEFIKEFEEVAQYYF